MHASPRLRRLRNDFTALEQLRTDSSVFSFTAHGNPPHHYQLTFKGRSLWRDRGQVRPLEVHRVEIKLGASYPRTMPEIRWITPIYHPNISEIGMVCLGGYGTNWVPSVQLDELCTMLWDMARYHNYDIRSPYNRDSALWAANQVSISFPTDSRPLRDLRAAQGRIVPTPDRSEASADRTTAQNRGHNGGSQAKQGVALKVRRFAQFYGMIFGSDQDSEILHELVETRTRPAPPASENSPPVMTASENPQESSAIRSEPAADLGSSSEEPVMALIEYAQAMERALATETEPGAEFVFQDVQEHSRLDRPVPADGDEDILFIT